MKRCGMCDKVLPLEAFSARSLSKDGKAHTCKACMREYRKKYAATMSGWARRKYAAMRYRCANEPWYTANGIKVELSLEEFEQFVEKNWQKIKGSDWPSVDRIDNAKGYTAENIRIICHRLNAGRSKAKAVTLEKEGEPTFICLSYAHAAELLNVTKNSVWRSAKRGGECRGYKVTCRA